MKRTLHIVVLLVGCVVGTGCAAQPDSQAAPAPPLDRMFVQIADVPLGPSMDRIDYQSLDPAGARHSVTAFDDLTIKPLA
jgi:hypothetical protein